MIPAHDEALRIGETLDRILSHPGLEGLEVLVVDDGSTDATAEVVASYGDRVRLERLPQCRGKGAAVRAGVLAATRPWILFVDADLPVELSALRYFAEAALAAPIVIASKHLRASSANTSLRRRLAGKAGNLLIRALIVRGFRDTQCGFKLFRADVARELFTKQRLDGFGFDFEVLFLARQRGHAVVELPTVVNDRGTSTVSASSYLDVLREVFQVLRNRFTGTYD